MGRTEEFYIDSDGIRVHSKLDFPDGVEKGPMCILIPGFTGHMEEEHIIGVKDAMNEAGVIVLRSEMYGHGGSGGEFKDHTLYKWVTNALSVVEYARSLSYVTDLYLSGHSQGGLLAVLIAGMRPDDFKALIPLSPALVIPDDARRGSILGKAFDPKHIPEVIDTLEGLELSGNYVRVAQTIYPEDEIARYDGPVLIIHGDEDESVPYSCAPKAAKLYKNAKLITIEGEDHCYTRHLDQVQKAVRDFLISQS